MTTALRNLSCLAAWLVSLGVTATRAQAEPAAPGLPHSIQVVEWRPPGLDVPTGSRQRSHHALSFATDAPKPWLRSVGLDATECSMRLRLPSRISASRETASGLRFELQLQAGLGCKF